MNKILYILLLFTVTAFSQPAYESSSTMIAGQDAGVTIAYPSGSSVDDIIIAIVADADNDSFTVPSGWNTIASSTSNGNLSYHAMWKRYLGSEGANETFNSALSAGQLVWGVMHRFSGCLTSGTPYEGLSSALSNTDFASANIIATSNQLKVYALVVEDNVSFTNNSFADWTTQDNQTTTTGSDGRMLLSTSTNIAQTTHSVTLSSSEYIAHFNLKLIPEPISNNRRILIINE